MAAKTLMIQGTGSDVGKSVVVAGLCRAMRLRGVSVAPFKPQNMSNNAAACRSGGEIGRAQAVQARAAEIEPTVDLNPVLLKPQSDRAAQVIVHGRAVSCLDASDFLNGRQHLMQPVLESYGRLASKFDMVLVEGAGSAAETNLRKNDIANMGFARRAKVPVCLLADIDKGGVIASIVGTKAVIDQEDAALIRSFLVNKFRGDVSLFEDGVRDIERHTKWPCRGIIPWLRCAGKLPQEDSIVSTSLVDAPKAQSADVTIAVPMLSRIANSDDFDPLRMEPNVNVVFVPPGDSIPIDADAIILPGTKSTIADLKFIRAQGWDHDIIAYARAGGRVLGICGGYQILGKRVRDSAGIEGEPEELGGLGLLDVETEMLAEKRVSPLEGECVRTGAAIKGYEIHIGKTLGPDCQRRFVRFADTADGAGNIAGNVSGCYVHGLFGNDEFRASWLNEIRDGSAANLEYDAAIDLSLDQLAENLEQALDIDALLRDAQR